LNLVASWSARDLLASWTAQWNLVFNERRNARTLKAFADNAAPSAFQTLTVLAGRCGVACRYAITHYACPIPCGFMNAGLGFLAAWYAAAADADNQLRQ